MVVVSNKWTWDRQNTPGTINCALESLRELWDLDCNDSTAKKLVFEAINADEVTSEVEYTAGGAIIRYNTLSAALRGVGSAVSGISGRQSTSFTMLGIMLDLSRNQVFTLEALKKMFKRLALLGYNTIFLYCEDTYELPGEPAFGMMRGRYTAADIRAMDDAASAVGIELIGCMQTLGHMQQILRWTGAYGQIRDTASVMRVDVPETHKLIGKMLDFWRDNLRSRRIHVGMDETHDLGRGRYMDENGYKNGFSLFTEQLNLVNKACQERGLQPMIWSDMFFRLGNPKQEYYDLNSKIPAEVRAQIPENVQLVYWDYYHEEQQFYEDFIDMHRDLGGEPLMGAGIWIWSHLWYASEFSGAMNRACINGCRNKNLKEIFFTMWGDDGAICHWDSAWTGLTEAADLSYGIDDVEAAACRYKFLTGGDYKVDQLPGKTYCWKKIGDMALEGPHFTDMAMFWDDLLLGLGWRDLAGRDLRLPDELLKHLRAVLDELTPHRNDRSGTDLYYGWLTVRYLHDKLACRNRLVKAYQANDRAVLQQLADQDIPQLAAVFDELMQQYRKQWLSVSRPFGLETMQHRMGGQKERILEAARRINDYLAGICVALDELEQPLPECNERMHIYQDMASGSVYV